MIYKARIAYFLIITFFMVMIVSISGCSSWQMESVDCTKKMMAVGVPYKDAAKMCYNMHKPGERP